MQFLNLAQSEPDEPDNMSEPEKLVRFEPYYRCIGKFYL